MAAWGRGHKFVLRFLCLKVIATWHKRQNHFENDLQALRYGERWKAYTPNPFGALLAPPVHTLIFKNMNALFWTSECCSLFSRTHCQNTSFKSSTILCPAKTVVRQREDAVILEYYPLHSKETAEPTSLHQAGTLNVVFRFAILYHRFLSSSLLQTYFKVIYCRFKVDVLLDWPLEVNDTPSTWTIVNIFVGLWPIDSLEAHLPPSYHAASL